MSPRRDPPRRRPGAALRRSAVVRSLLAAVLGVLIGVGLAVALGQQGVLDPRGMVVAAATGIVVAVLLTLVHLPRGLRVTVAWVSRALAVVALVALPVLPANAIPCLVEIDVDGPGGEPPRDAMATTSAQPLPVLLEDGRRVVVRAAADVPDGSVVDVTIVDVQPSLLLDLGSPLLLSEPIRGGEAVTELEVVAVAPPQSFVVRTPGRGDRLLPPLGVVQLRTEIRSTGGSVELCDGGDQFIQLVAAPGTNPYGQAAIGALVLGLLLLPGLLVESEPDLGDLPPPRARPRELDVTAAEPVPARGAWHLDTVETRIVDVNNGRVLTPDEALLVGGSYQMHVSVAASLAPAVAPSSRLLAEVVVVGAEGGARPEPAPVDPATGLAVIGLRPRAAGRSTTVLDVLHRGHLVQVERVSLPAVEPGETTDEVQSTRTSMASAEVTASAMEARSPRDVLVVVEVVDGRVVTRVHAAGAPLVTAAPAAQGALVPATAALATAVRDTLTDRLRDAGGQRLDLPPVRGDEDLQALARVGREMRHALVGPEPAALTALRRHVVDGATVQVVQDTTGLGAATLPYQLLYDHPLSIGAERLEVCAGDHPVDSCPSTGRVDVVCPSGLWGYRAIVEEMLPRTEADPTPRPPVVARVGARAAAYVDQADELHRDPQRPDDPVLDVVAELGLEPLDDVAAVVRALGEDVGLLYLYGHSGAPEYVSEVGLSVGAGFLLGSDLRERGLRRPAGGLVVVNACGSGAARVTDVMTLLRALVEVGSTAVVATETTMWAPFANRLAYDLLERLADGEAIGRALLEQRRAWWREHNNHVGLTFRLHGLADAVWLREEPTRLERPAAHGREDVVRP